MTTFHRMTAAILFALTAASWAAEVPSTSPGVDDQALLQWKKDVLDRYQQVLYQGADQSTISEAEFFRALRERRAPFSMTHEVDRLDRIVVRLLSAEEVAASTQKK